MKKLAVVLLLMMAGTAWGQNDLPLTYKGTCTGNQTDVHDLSAIQDTPAIKCDSLTVMQKGSETIASFSNGDPTKPVLAFTGEIFTVRANQLSVDPYQGPIGLAFPIDHVLWGDGTPPVSIHPAENVDKMGDRGCYFHFLAQGWTQLTTAECDLAVDTPNHRPRRVQVTFRVARQFMAECRSDRGVGAFSAIGPRHPKHCLNTKGVSSRSSRVQFGLGPAGSGSAA